MQRTLGGFDGPIRSARRGQSIGASDIASSPHAGIRIGITPLELSRWASAQVCQVVHPNVDFRSAKDRRRPFAERKATLVHITRFNLCTDRVHLSTFAPRRIPFAGAKGDDGRRPGGDPPAAAPDWLRRIGPAAGHLEPGAQAPPAIDRVPRWGLERLGAQRGFHTPRDSPRPPGYQDTCISFAG